MKLKKGCGIGCLALFTAAVVLMGAATWYSREINREYKAVQKTENALLAATENSDFVPPVDLVIAPARLDAFLAVRDSVQREAQILTAAANDFARERDRTQGQGIKGFLNLLRAGSGLAPVYATYWSTRNRALLAAEMGPDEYIWLYSLVYYNWLGKDSADGRDEHTTADEINLEIRGDLPAATADELAPRRLHLEATYNPQLNPIELIFHQTRSAATSNLNVPSRSKPR